MSGGEPSSIKPVSYTHLNGVTFEMDGQVMQVVEFQHVKPGKGAAFVRTKMKNVITGGVTETSFNPTAKFESAYVAVSYTHLNQAEGGQPAGLFRFGGAEMGPEAGQNIQGKRDGFFQQKVGDGGLGQSAVFEHGQADGQEAGAELLPRGAAWGGLSGVTAELRRHDLIHGSLEQGVLGMEAVVDHG